MSFLYFKNVLVIDIGVMISQELLDGSSPNFQDW